MKGWDHAALNRAWSNRCSRNYTGVMPQDDKPGPHIEHLHTIRDPDGVFGQRGQQWEPTAPRPPIVQSAAPKTPPPSKPSDD